MKFILKLSSTNLIWKISFSSLKDTLSLSVFAWIVVILLPIFGFTQPLPITSAERLSNFVKSKGLQDQEVMWNSPHEIQSQQALKDQLLKDLRGPQSASVQLTQTSDKQDSGTQSLSAFIEKLPVTGRILLKTQDPRWLETHPQEDPILTPKDSLKVLDRKKTVTVILGNGRVCVIPFKRSVYAFHYTKLCLNADNVAPDWAWVIQADGSREKVSLSSWNAKTQKYPGVGSWIWAPSGLKGFAQISQQMPWKSHQLNKDFYPDELSERFATFLATQGPSDQTSLIKLIRIDRTFVDDIVFDLKLDQSEKYQPKDATPIASDWGSIGLLQTPSARMLPEGSGLISYSHTTPYSHYNFLLQPFNWLETSFRYSTATNQVYGAYEFSGNQSYTDKSIDLKIRLLEETSQVPQVAIGIRDLNGTGLFSGEYIVGNKRYGNFDFSVGLGWGYIGNRGDLKNPLSIFGSSLNTRPPKDIGPGGNLSFGTYFRGQTALIGGVQYQTPYPNLSIKLELDGNNYQHEPFGDTFSQRLPINFGAVYRWNNANITIGIERGNTAMISMSLFDNLSKLSTPKLAENPPPAIAYRPIPPPSNVNIAIPNIDPWQTSLPQLSFNPQGSGGVSQDNKIRNQDQIKPNVPPPTSDGTHQDLTQSTKASGMDIDISKTSTDIAAQSGWHLVQIEQKNHRWIVTLDDVNGVYLNDRINRVVAVLHRDAPTSVSEFVVQYQQHQLPLIKQSFNRQAWMMKNISLVSPSQAKLADPVVSDYSSNVLISSASSKTLSSESDHDYLLQGPPAKRLTGGLDIGFQQNIGGPDGYLFAVSGQARGNLRLWDGAWISGTASLRLLDNYDNFTYDAPSNLPRVRTYIREYLTTSRVTLPLFQATQVVKVGDSHYFSAYGGMLEMMFGGVGGEWLYRPLNSALAIGVDVNEVRQRDFDQRFTFLDYQTFTGHATGYWQTGWENVLAKVSYGQYLAGDRGYTVDLSKAFSNGVRMGAYFTKTNVSAEQFGEGSFDKGIYVAIPFDTFFTKYSNNSANILWNPLIRDGGAKLNRAYPLYKQTNMIDRQAMWFGSGQ